MVTIRRELPDDAERIAGVHVRAWQAGYAGIIPAEVLDRLNVNAWAQRRRDWGTACDHLADGGRNHLRLWVLADNARARKFYERAGLAADGESTTYTIPLSGGRDPVALEEIRYAAVIG